MKCPTCQYQNREGVNFCEQCGAKMEVECPNCKAGIPPDKRFCGRCGQALTEPSGVPPEPPPSREAERKHVTVLFSDLSGYTAMSEKLDPEEVREITTRIFGEVALIVARYEGFVEKYVGDAVLALFGVPHAHEDDHIRAILAAREIHAIVSAAAADYEKKIGRPLTFHSGIATGLVVTGEINLEKGVHGVAGDTVNLASRLASLAKPGEILVGESTYLRGKGAFLFERLQSASLKGKAEPVTPYRLVEGEAGTARRLAPWAISSPLVGRTAEVAAIRSCLNRLLGGQGGILSLIGEAGLGKSRLMAEIRRYYQNENLLWLEGKTLSYGQKMSYWPFREILCHFAGITEDDKDVGAWEKLERKIADLFPSESGQILPYLASLIGLEVKGELAKNLAHMDGESMGKQIYLSSRRFLERLAEKPLILVFEDLHWADESTVLLIEHLFPLTDRVSLLISWVSRPEAGIPAMRLRETALRDHERRYTEIRLNPLSPTECTQLMDNLLAIENLSSRARQLILMKADGNPFFVEEIMRTLVDRGAVRPERGRWKATSHIETIAIPDTIQGVIMARIDRLDEELKQVLKAASVIGRVFLYRLLKEVTAAAKELDEHLDTLTATELIRERQRIPELEYIFKHALVQESTYESILLKKRQELHGKVASAIETLFSDRLDEFSSVLAYHYARAESWEKAQAYLLKAGDQAGRIAADAEALTHYHQALETYTRVFGDKWDPVQRGILERKMGEAFYRRGETQKAMDYLQRALADFGRPELPTASSAVRLGILREIGKQLAYRLFSRSSAKKTYGPAGHAVEEVARVYEIVATLCATTEPERFLLATLTSLNFSERKGHLSGIVSESASMVMICYFFYLFRLGKLFLRRAVVLAKQTQDPSALVIVHLILAFTENNAGRLDRAIEDGLKGIEIGRKSGYWNLALWGYLNNLVSMAYYYRGDIRNCLTIAHKMVRYGQDANDPTIVTVGLFCLGRVLERKGDFQESAAALARAIELAESIPLHLHRVWSGSFLGKCYCRTGDIEKSLDILTQTDAYRAAHAVRGWDWVLLIALFMAYLAAAEERAGAERKQYLMKARRASKSVFRWAKGYPVCLPEATRLQGVYEWLLGRNSSAEMYWNRSLAMAKEMDMRYDLAMTHLEIGRRLNSLEHLKQAETVFADLGAEWDLDQVRRLAQPLAELKSAW